MCSKEPKVFIVDDDASVLTAVSRLLQAAGVRSLTFSSATDFLDHYERNAPGCVLLDFAMPGLNGLEIQTELAAAGDTKPVVFLTGQASVPISVSAMKAGAVDVLTKPVERDDLIRAVGAALAKDAAIRTGRQAVEETRRHLASLTPREYEVFEYVVSGYLNKQIASALGTAEKTIKVHRGRVMQKMNVLSVAELARWAERLGIAELEQEH